jgi:hypothetical protein
MRWTSLGHAGWLVEASGLRILCDPLLGETLHGGLHLVHPPREVHVEALRPDLLVISHAHPDHFDVPSLARLARLHPQVPVLTADPLVAQAVRALGFQTASVLPSRTALSLGEVTLLTTPSLGQVTEWGLLVHDRSGTAWNQVDSVLKPETVRAVREGLRAATGTDRVELGLVHWCPLREVETSVAGALGFPFRDWADKLAALAALQAPVVVPAAAGFRHLPPFSWRDAHVFPVTEAGLARDLHVVAPDTGVVSCPPGSALLLDGPGTTPQLLPSSELATALPCPPRAAWAPLSVPPIVDPALEGQRAAELRAAVHPWLQQQLLPALARHVPALGLGRPVRLALVVVLPDDPISGSREHHLFTADGAGVTHTMPSELDPEHDAVVEVAGSMLADVIAGRRHWGEPLLAGLLRGARRLKVLPVFFPYWALSYQASVERWVQAQVAAARGGQPCQPL